MSLVANTANKAIPSYIMEYAIAHAAEGTTIYVLSAESDSGFDWVATGEDSDLDQLYQRGYTTVGIYAPNSTIIADNPMRYVHSDDHCC